MSRTLLALVPRAAACFALPANAGFLGLRFFLEREFDVLCEIIESQFDTPEVPEKKCTA